MNAQRGIVMVLVRRGERTDEGNLIDTLGCVGKQGADFGSALPVLRDWFDATNAFQRLVD